MAKTAAGHGITKGRAGPEDVEIGRKVRALRLAARETQSTLGDVLGVTFQQVQKYEKGTNRIPSTALSKICQHYGRSIDYFIMGAVGTKPRGRAAEAGAVPNYIVDQSSARLNAAFTKIKNAGARRLLAQVVELIAQPDHALRGAHES